MKVLLCSLIFPLAIGFKINMIEKIGLFCSNHNFKILSVLNPNYLSYFHLLNKTLMNMGIKMKTIENITEMEDQDFMVMFYTPKNTFKDWAVLSHRRIKSALFILQHHHMENLTTIIANTNLNINIYCLFYKNYLYEFKELLTMKNQHKVIVKSINETIIDLQGIHISVVTAEWKPYFIVNNCNQTGKNCNYKGIAVDIMNRAAEIMNFTWKAEITNDWGLSPKSGPFNISGNWGGVLGNVIMGNYGLSITNWRLTLQRMDLLDHAMQFKSDPNVMLTNSAPPIMDLEFYKRPFKNQVWILITIITVTSCITVNVITHYSAITINANASKIIHCSMWIFFTLVHAFYGSSLTMLFITETEVPFANLNEAIMAFPNWNTIFISGMDVAFEEPSRQVKTQVLVISKFV